MLTFHNFLGPAWLGFPSTSVIKPELELSSSVLTQQIPLGRSNHPSNFNYHLILMNSTCMCHSHLACPKLNFSPPPQRATSSPFSVPCFSDGTTIHFQHRNLDILLDSLTSPHIHSVPPHIDFFKSLQFPLFSSSACQNCMPQIQ